MPDPVLTATRVERIDMPAGQAGVDLTVDTMAKMAMGQFGAGSARIRDLALSIIHDANVPEKDQIGEVIAIHKWVQDRLRYVKDPTWYEYVTYPETLAFDQPDGDCDDHCVLEAALLGAVGIITRFVTFGFGSNPVPSHVALQAQTKSNGWVYLDPIVKSQPAGWHVPDATLENIYGINTVHGVQGSTFKKAAKMVALAIGIWGAFAWFHETAKRLEK